VNERSVYRLTRSTHLLVWDLLFGRLTTGISYGTDHGFRLRDLPSGDVNLNWPPRDDKLNGGWARVKVLAGLANGRISSAFVVQPGIGPFSGLDARDAVELGELLAFLGDWLASDPDRLEAPLSDFVGLPGYVGAVCKVDELRAAMDRFARMLLGYDWAG
jgi:hypothetical protein